MPRSKRPGFAPTLTAFCALPFLAAVPLHSQVFTVEAEHVEKHYTEFPPTHVKYSEMAITSVGRDNLVRFMQAEQGFAMRPLPIATLNLHANGHMDPTGEKYVEVLHQKGTSVKAGDRVVVTDIKFHEKSIELDLNGGPEHKHKYLRHISIGMGAAEVPLAQDSGAPPTGSRITLVFEESVPDLNGEQLEALLKPMIDFGVKSPAEAFAESLPSFLRKAVAEHRILVGMDRDLVIYSKSQPTRKIRETDEGKPVEIWIYGEAPQPVEFVYFQGSYVTRIQLAKVGEPMEERTENEMGDYFGNLPVVAKNQHEVKLGDQTDADRTEENAPRAAPTLRKPGEQLPADNDKDNPHPVMAPVKMPPDLQRPGDPGYTPTVSAKPTQGTQSPAQGTPTSGSSQVSTQTSGQGTQQDNSSQPKNGQSSSQQQQNNSSPDSQTNPLDKPQ
jgi:hypothetical protein